MIAHHGEAELRIAFAHRFRERVRIGAAVLHGEGGERVESHGHVFTPIAPGLKPARRLLAGLAAPALRSRNALFG